MRIQRHVYLILVATFAGAAVGFFGLGFLILASLTPRLPPWAQFLVLAASSALGYYLPQWIISRWLPARCPQCGGSSYPAMTGRGQIRYTCHDCGQCVDTGIIVGGGDADGPA